MAIVWRRPNLYEALFTFNHFIRVHTGSNFGRDSANEKFGISISSSCHLGLPRKPPSNASFYLVLQEREFRAYSE